MLYHTKPQRNKSRKHTSTKLQSTGLANGI